MTAMLTDEERAKLVERLHNRDAVVMSGLYHAIPAMRDAADEIERLSSALLAADAAVRGMREANDLGKVVGLVPKGWNWSVEHFEFDATLPYREPGAKASVWRDSRNPKERVFNVEGKTPALALRAAIEKATKP